MSANRVLATSALVLAGAGLLVGSDAGPGTGPDVTALARELSAGPARVDAVELAAAIRSRRPLRIVDVREASDFIRFSIPTAEHADHRALPALATRLDPSVEVVLYDDGDGAAIGGWLLLRRLGHPRVRVLEGGVLGWIEGVLEPVLPVSTATERETYARVAELSRYFGGRPRTGTPAPATSDRSADQAVRLLSRRGCY